MGLLQLNQQGENKLIKHYFVDWDPNAPVKRARLGVEPSEMLLYEMGEPGQKSHTQMLGDTPTFEEYASMKSKTFKNWELLNANELQRVCRKIIAVCIELDTPSSRTSADAISALQDLAISEYTILERAERLGTNNIRFKRRMWAHLQYACTYRLVFCGAMGANVFRNHIRERYPEVASTASKAGTRRKYRRSPSRSPRKFKQPPRNGCWRCPSPDHYAANCPVRGQRDVVPASVQKQILARIANDASMSAAEKKKEVADVKNYWADGRMPGQSKKE